VDGRGRVKPKRYHYWGLRVESDLDLPDWGKFEQTEGAFEADVRIRIAAEAGEFLSQTPQTLVTPMAYRTSVPGLGVVSAHGGIEIRITAEHGSTPARLLPWITGSAWAALCYQRGLFILHASAVVVNGKAFAFCARARGGKSTLAANLNARGFPLISDDLCRLEVSQNREAYIYPSPPRMRLWVDAVTALGWTAESLQPDQTRAGKYHASADFHIGLARIPLRAIYMLDWGELRIARRSGIRGLSQFLPAATYRPKLVERMGKSSEHVAKSVSLLQTVSLWEFRRPRALELFDEGLDAVVAHLSESYD